MIPEGVRPFPAVEDPDEVADIPSTFALIPAQQVPFYDGCELLLPRAGDFAAWMTYAMKAESFRPSEVLEAITWFDLPAGEEAAYDAPFPSRVYMAGVRVFPSLVNELGGQNDEAWAGLTSFQRPFLTLWASNDPGNLGQCATQQQLIDSIPGAAGQPHDRLAEASHFLQDDQGEEIARRLVTFYSTDTSACNSGETDEMSEPRVGFEVLQRVSPTETIVWLSTEITQTDFDAIELPPGWFKNQPREGEPDAGRFARSPDAAADGTLTMEEHFGHVWQHPATVVETGVRLDEDGLLIGPRVAKFHEITFHACRTLVALISPEGDAYVRASRDAGRSSDTPTLPAGWRMVHYVTPDELVMQLPNPTLVIRADNQDSFQGPVSELDIEP